MEITLRQAYQDYAAALGRSVESLTADEKDHALFNAVMESARSAGDFTALDAAAHKFFMELAEHQFEPGVYDRMRALYEDGKC